MAVYGVMQVGRLALREDSSVDVAQGGFGTTLSLSGQESMPRVTLDQLKQRVDDLIALRGKFLPVTFTQKPELDGFYWVTDASGTYDKWMPDGVGVMPWTMTLERAGYESEMDIESRLSGPVTRANDHLATGERWHAPAIGHKLYHAGSTVPTGLVRASSEGPITVYRGLALDANPRWAVSPAGYLAGRVRLTDSLGRERVGDRASLVATGWEVHNGLVKFSHDTRLNLYSWSNGSWTNKRWDIQYGTGSLLPMGTPDYVNVLRNDFEAVTLRLTKNLSPGRLTVDITLRRGSRFIEVYVQHPFGTTLRIALTNAEQGVSSAGYITASTDDAMGNRYVLGSSKSFAADTGTGAISKDSTPALDAFIGVAEGQDTSYPNLDFEAATLSPGWSATNATIAIDTSIKHSGSKSVKVTPSGASFNPRVEGNAKVIAAVSGSKFYVRAWVYATTSWSPGFQIGANFHDVNGAWLVTSMVTPATVVPIGIWTQIEGVVTAPVNASIAWALPRIQLASPGNPAATDVYYVDDAMIRPETPAGDQAADLFKQYLGVPSETVQGVRR